jgi:hypothetical protein
MQGQVMAEYDPFDSESDPFKPPATSTLVSCLHCRQEYDSFRIEWRVLRAVDGKPHGFWCCPIPGCDGKGFGFDIFPVDPDFQDERGGWFYDDELEDDVDDASSDDGPPGKSDSADPQDVPW